LAVLSGRRKIRKERSVSAFWAVIPNVREESAFSFGLRKKKSKRRRGKKKKQERLSIYSFLTDN